MSLSPPSGVESTGEKTRKSRESPFGGNTIANPEDAETSFPPSILYFSVFIELNPYTRETFKDIILERKENNSPLIYFSPETGLTPPRNPSPPIPRPHNPLI
jgi:hypothetical protein